MSGLSSAPVGVALGLVRARVLSENTLPGRERLRTISNLAGDKLKMRAC